MFSFHINLGIAISTLIVCILPQNDATTYNDVKINEIFC